MVAEGSPTGASVRLTDYLAIVAAALVSHGLLLLNDGVYWDAWILHSKLMARDWSSLYSWYAQSGVPSFPYLYWFVAALGGPVFGFACVSFLSILLAAICVYLIGIETGWLSSQECLWVSLLSLAYPAFQASVSAVVMPYLLCYFLFLLGFQLAFRAERQQGWRHWTGRLCALLLLAASFNTSSLLVFHFGFQALLILHASRVRGLGLDRIPSVLARRLDYVLLPFVFFAIMRAAFPPHGEYASYHQFIFSPLSIAGYALTFVEAGAHVQLREAGSWLDLHPATLAGVLLFGLSSYSIFGMGRRRFAGTVKPLPMALIALMLLTLGIFPYAAIGETAASRGWWTRHTLLMALPMALLLIAFTRLLFERTTGVLARPGYVLLILLLAGFTAVQVRTYLEWQARWVKDRALIAKFASMVELKPYSIFWIDDRYVLGGQKAHATYEWGGMFKAALGNEAHLGIERYYRATLSSNLKDAWPATQRENLTQYDPNGAQAEMIISAGPGAASQWKMSSEYFYFRFFAPERLDRYLDGIVEVRVSPVLANPADARSAP